MDSTRHVGHYLLEERIGVGGFSTVWRATHLPSGRAVAVKMLDPALLRQEARHGPTSRDRFLGEAKMLMNFDHPNVVKVIDLVLDVRIEPVAIVMELLRGADLSVHIERMGLRQFLEVMISVADTLGDLHRVGILHRDVKLSNVFICEPTPQQPGASAVKLIDFGIAKDLTEESLRFETATGFFAGSYFAAPPEMFQRIFDRQVPLTPAVDQWSFGVALYQGLSGGRLPFRAEGFIPLARQAILEPPAPLELAEHFELSKAPESLDRCVERCLRKPPALRFSDMYEVATALRVALADIDPTWRSDVVYPRHDAHEGAAAPDPTNTATWLTAPTRARAMTQTGVLAPDDADDLTIVDETERRIDDSDSLEVGDRTLPLWDEYETIAGGHPVVTNLDPPRAPGVGWYEEDLGTIAVAGPLDEYATSPPVPEPQGGPQVLPSPGTTGTRKKSSSDSPFREWDQGSVDRSAAPNPDLDPDPDWAASVLIAASLIAIFLVAWWLASI